MSQVKERQVASMGPRPRGRGNPAQNASLTNQLGFNGAAPARARKWRSMASMSVSTVKASMGPRPRGRGNLRQGVNALLSNQSVASMGPRPRGRGNHCDIPECVSLSTVGFNGAAPARAREIRCVQSTALLFIRFNGAAPARARKFEAQAAIKPAGGRLQWGRARAGAEINIDTKMHHRRIE